MAQIGGQTVAQGAAGGALRDLTGAKVGRWWVERELGRGGMATVYRAHHEATHAGVAIKVLHAPLANVPDIARRFINEARALSMVSHPNVARVYELGLLPGGSPCIVMELLEGETLEQRAALGKMAHTNALPLLLQICDGLAAAHAAGVIHRDVKAENVALVRTREGSELVKVFDFGIARMQAEQGATLPGTVMGTPHYMAPEQVLGGRIDERTDVYALGVLAHRLLAGELPFTGRSVPEVLRKHLRDDPPVLVDVPEALSSLVRRALSKDPRDRPASACELGAALRECMVAPPPTDFTANVTASGEICIHFASQQAFERVEREQLQHKRLFVPLEAGELPRELLLRVEVAGGVRFSVKTEFARQLGRDEASRFGLPPGFAVSLRAESPSHDAQEARKEIERLQRRAAAGSYQLLGLEPDARAEQIAAACQRVEQRLAVLDSVADREIATAIAGVRQRLAQAGRDLGDPEVRAWQDALLGNYRGVARCLLSGLKLDRLDLMARDWSNRWPERAQKARSLAAMAWGHLKTQDRRRALDLMRCALEVAPLDIESHRRYWTLRRELVRASGRMAS